MLNTLNSPAPQSAPPAARAAAAGHDSKKTESQDDFGKHLEKSKESEEVKATDEGEQVEHDQSESVDEQTPQPKAATDRTVNLPVSLVAALKKVDEEGAKANVSAQVDETDTSESELLGVSSETDAHDDMDNKGRDGSARQMVDQQSVTQVRNGTEAGAFASKLDAPNSPVLQNARSGEQVSTQTTMEAKPLPEGMKSEKVGEKVKVDIETIKTADVDDNAGLKPLQGDAKSVLALTTPGKTLVDAVRENSNWSKTMASASVSQAIATKPDGTVLQTLKVQLNPIDLGKIDLNLKIVQGTMQIDVRTETIEAYRNLSLDQNGLAETLRGMGLKVDALTISGPQQADSNNFQQGQNGNADQKAREHFPQNGERQHGDESAGDASNDNKVAIDGDGIDGNDGVRNVI